MKVQSCNLLDNIFSNSYAYLDTILNKEFPVRYHKFTSTFAPGIQFILLSRSRLDFSYKIRKGDIENEFFF